MRVLIRFLSRPRADALEQRDRRYEGEALTLGRATDQVLHLKDRRVALQHARITMEMGRPVIKPVGAASLVINRRPVGEARLRPGDRIDIGANILKVLEPPAGYDLALSFELDPAAARRDAGAEAPRLDLASTGWSMRRWSWLAFTGVLLVALAIPAAGVLDVRLQPALRGSLLPDDGLWLAGPLAAVHHNIGTRCEACHQRPFERVQNGACLECHQGTVGRHVAATVGIHTSLDAARCASCHAEHNEPATLLLRDERLCADCHAGITQVAGPGTALQDVSGFASDHPGFRTGRLLAGERSGLVFPHDQHLAAQGIDSPDGTRILDCGDCHRPEADGRRMQPIRMESHCAGCHRLDFDPADPGARVPHGDAGTVMRRLVEYYSRSYLEGYPDPEARALPGRPLARPGAVLSPRQRDWLLERARTRADEVARDLFERRACSGCHAVEGDGSEARPWKVAPVRLTTRYFPAANFSHARHGTALSACDDCHAARESSASADLLMPTIATCRECHGSGDPRQLESGRVASDCVMCHAFHRADLAPWPAPGGP